MTTSAILDTFYTINDTNAAELRESWEDPISVLSDVENGNTNPSLTVITNPLSGQPTIYVDRHSTAGSLWRHFVFGVANGANKKPLFKVNRATKDGTNINSGYRPLLTQNFDNWVQASFMNLVGGTSGTIEFGFNDPLPPGDVFISSNLTGRREEAAALANLLLTTHASIASPTTSANSSGVYAVTPAENNSLGSPIGGNDQYAIKLSWANSTTDGLRKRKAVLLSGMHSAGEQICWPVFKHFIDKIINGVGSEYDNFRANFDVYAYWNLNANGIRGGHWRHNFRTESGNNMDRSFIPPSGSGWQEVNNLMASHVIDFDGSADLFISFHGYIYDVSTEPIVGLNPDEYYIATRSPPYQALFNAAAARFGQSVLLTSGSDNPTDIAYGRDHLNAVISFDIEINSFQSSSESKYISMADNWLKSIVDIDQAGLFLANNLTVANCAQTDTSSSGSISLGGIALTGANCDQTDTSSVSVISQLHILVPASSTQGANSGTGVITLTNGNLVAANSTQTDISGTGAIDVSSVINLTAANSAQTDISQTAIITQTHILIAAPSVQDDVASSSAIVQLHLLLAANSIQTDASSSATIINPLDSVEIPRERIIAAMRDNRIIYIDQWGRYGH